MKKNILERVHIIILAFLRALVRVLYFIPICQKRIMFSSYLGESYSCNPKYLSEYIQSNFPGEYEIIWAFKDTNKFLKLKGVKCIRYKSFKWLFFHITSKVIIVNNGAVWIPRRKGQLIIDTWHGGGCYKRVAFDNKNSSRLANYRTKISSKEVNLYLSSSQYFSHYVVRDSFLFDGEILPSGMPRNDILFEDGIISPKPSLRIDIARKYSFDPQKYIVLFAPTWRKGHQRMEQLDVAGIKGAIKTRFGRDVVVLGRGHHTENKILEDNVIDVTTYPDMQELLVVTDMLITDYSSSMWDFSFTEKPCLLFTPDLDIYSEDPGFDCDIYSWGFPISRNNQELVQIIKSFDSEKYKKMMENHHNTLINYDKGHACKMVCEYIEKFCEKN